jgi:tetratricopeptide (TPR) repeat protein
MSKRPTAVISWFHRFNLFILFLVPVLVLVMRGANVSSWVSINQWGLQVVRHCFGLEQSRQMSVKPPINGNHTAMFWLTAQKADCQQDQDEAELAWRQTLANTSERLTLVRSAAPYNVALAQYAAELYPEQAEAYFWLGDAYREEGQNPQALQAYETGLTWQPEQDANAWMSVGRLYEAEGAWEQAVHAYSQACHYVDQGKNGCPHAGRLYLAHEQYELAAQRYRDSLNQLPGWHPARLGLAQALLELGQIEEAQAHLTLLANEGNRAAQDLLNQLSENQTQP